MSFEILLPIIMVGLSLGTAAGYFLKGDPARGIYWLFGAGITYTVTFVIK